MEMMQQIKTEPEDYDSGAKFIDGETCEVTVKEESYPVNLNADGVKAESEVEDKNKSLSTEQGVDKWQDQEANEEDDKCKVEIFLDEDTPEVLQEKDSTSENCNNTLPQESLFSIHMSLLAEGSNFAQNATPDSLTYQKPKKKRKESGRIYKCNTCQKCFTRNYDLHAHIRTHTGERPFTCDVCNQTFSYKSSFKRHMRVHTLEIPCSCNECCETSDCLQSEKRTCIHKDGKQYVCSICNTLFSAKANLVRHRRKHTEEKLFTCHLCDKSFLERAYLVRHIRVHTKKKPFHCYFCDRPFSSKCNLSKHVKLHMGDKPYKCNLCVKTFPCKSNLMRHIRSHTSDKPFSCLTCGRLFSDQSHLARHKKRIHKKPYRCGVCNRAFYKQSNLALHARRLHEELHDM